MSKVVLEEEQYVETLERIIERDFFPDLPALRQQHQRLRHDGATEEDTESVATTARRGPRTYAGTLASATRSESSSWDQPTPSRAAVDDTNGNREADGNQKDPDVQSELRAEDLTLDRFVATHTSEDNAAFTELQAKALEDHKRRFHWAYDSDHNKGEAQLHLLTNGQWISKEQRRLVDDVLAPKGPPDDRPSAPETWPFRARNALLFVPELEVSNQICKVNQSDNVRLLENGHDTEDVSSRAVTNLKHDSSNAGLRSRGKRETVYANSRFQADATETSGMEAVSLPSRIDELDLVQMTPQIAPGVDASPLMTWGNIEGTPMILDAPANPDQVLNGPRFIVKESSTREKVANRLESQSRLRKSQSRQQTPTPLIMRGKRPGELPTPSRAESIRSRLSSMRSAQRTPLFGSNSELRASYGTPLLPPRHSKSKK